MPRPQHERLVVLSSHVRPQQLADLQRLSEATKVAQAVYVREGLDLVLRQYELLIPSRISDAEIDELAKEV